MRGTSASARARDEPNAEPTGRIRKSERHARHVDGRNRANAVLLEIRIEQASPLASRSKTKQRLVANPIA